MFRTATSCICDRFGSKLQPMSQAIGATRLRVLQKKRSNGRSTSWYHPSQTRSFLCVTDTPAKLDAALHRAFDRKVEFMKLNNTQLFSPTIGFLRKCITFLELNFPENTHIDVEEFLNGARFAVESIIRDMHSREFMRYASGRGEETSRTLMLKEVLSSNCYEVVLDVMKSYEEGGENRVLRDVEVKTCHLLGASYVERKADDSSKIEKFMQLTVLCNGSELFDETNVNRRYVWWFESLIDDNSGELEWKVVHIA